MRRLRERIPSISDAKVKVSSTRRPDGSSGDRPAFDPPGASRDASRAGPEMGRDGEVPTVGQPAAAGLMALLSKSRPNRSQ
jgi:hypothetical protein